MLRLSDLAVWPTTATSLETCAAILTDADSITLVQTFQSIAKEIMVRLSSQQEGAAATPAAGNTVRVGGYAGAAASKKAACCST